MCRKCYTINAELHRHIWSVAVKVTDSLAIMGNGTGTFLPLYRHKFRLIQPHTIVEAEKFQKTFPTADQLITTGDKLRHLRYHHGLLQRDVAKHLGLSQRTYSRYESPEKPHYDSTILQKLADLYNIPPESIQ